MEFDRGPEHHSSLRAPSSRHRQRLNAEYVVYRSDRNREYRFNFHTTINIRLFLFNTTLYEDFRSPKRDTRPLSFWVCKNTDGTREGSELLQSIL